MHVDDELLPLPPAAALLLVDDNDPFRQTLERAFDRRGWEVYAAGSADEAMLRMAEGRPDYAVVDLNLDGSPTSGLDLIPRLLSVVPDLCIVVLTGYASIATAVRAVQLGATQYLSKPIEIDEIVAAFERKDGDSGTPLAPTPMSVNQLEWEHLQRVLLEHDGNISAAARALNLHRRSLQRKLRKHARW